MLYNIFANLSKLFGSLPIIFSKLFAQIFFIIKNSNYAQIINTYIKKCIIYLKFKN